MQGVFVRGTWSGRLWRVAAAALLAGLGACGGGGGGGDPVPIPVAPTITTQPASLGVHSGQTASFTVAAAGDAPLAYQWLRNGNAIAGAVQPSYTLAAPTIADAGSKFAVRVSNAAGTVTSADAVLTVTAAAVPLGISRVAGNLGNALDLAVDAQGNTIAVLQRSSATLAVAARKFAPDGSELPYGPDGQGLPLPGEAPNINFFSARHTGAAFAPSGEVYVSTITAEGASINAYLANGGRLSRVSADGQVTVLADWPARSAGAVAPAAVTLGPDGALYFVDYLSGHLMKRTPAGVVSSVADVEARPSIFFGTSRYHWIAVESADRAYVITNNSFASGLVLKRVQAGVVSVLAGSATFSLAPGVDGTGTAASFGRPSGLSLAGGGALYVADGTLLRKVTPEGAVTTVAGKAGSEVLVPGPLPGSLGFLGALTVGADGVVHVFSAETAGQFQSDRSLVKIRFQ